MATASQLAKQPRKRSAVALTALTTPPLSADELGAQARQAAEEILLAGQAENTLKSYRSALRYWCAWAVARYGFEIPWRFDLAVVAGAVVGTALLAAVAGLAASARALSERPIEALRHEI